MRTAKILAVMMLCAAVPAATNAQSTLTSVMDDFVKSHSNKEVKTATYLEYDENDSSDTRKPSTFHYEYDFNLPATDNKKIDKLINAFNKDTDKAYNVYTRNAGISDMSLANIAVGEKNKGGYNVNFGKHKERNYMVMLVRDKQNKMKRYVYAIVWYNDTADNRLCGSLHKIYGPDPNKQGSRNGYSGYGPDNIVYSDGEVTIYKNGKPAVIYNPGNMENLIDDEIETDSMSDSNRIYKRSLMSSDEFIRRFGIIHDAFMNLPPQPDNENGYENALLNKMVNLCDKHFSALDNTERKACLKCLAEMRQRCKNKYQEGLIDIARKRLRGYID